MSRTSFGWAAFTVALLMSAGCGGDDMLTGTQVALVASPASPVTGSPVTLTVTARNSEVALTAVSIDFESDGTWDAQQTFNQSSILTSFTHTYPAAGSVTVRAEVKDANNALTTQTLLLIVSAPAQPPVSYRISASSVAGGACYVEGPPATCPGCSTVIASTGTLFPLGAFPHGAPATVTQSFRQDEFLSGTTTVQYSCAFNLDLYAGVTGSEVLFAHGACSTTSIEPEELTCEITTSGTVP